MSAMTSITRKPALRRLPLAATLPIVVLAAMVAEVIIHATEGYVRADVLVLVVVFSEASRRLAAVAAVAASLITVLAQTPGDINALMRLVIAVALAAGGAWVLRSFHRSDELRPSLRFGLVTAMLLGLCVVASLLQMAAVLGVAEAVDAGDFWVRFFRRAVPIGAAMMLGAALWARPLSGGASRWLSRLSLGFVIVGLALVAPYLTSAYWASQEADTLVAAAATASSALNAGIGDDFNAYLARAGTAPRSPFANQAGFAAVNQSVLLGNTSLSALALLAPKGNGYVMKYEIDRLGGTKALAKVLGTKAADAPLVAKSGEVGAPLLLGIRKVPGSDGVAVPSLVFVSPQATKQPGDPEFLVVAISIPVNMADAIDTVGPDSGNIHFSLAQATPAEPGQKPLSLEFGPPAKEGSVAVSAPDAISFGDLPVLVSASAAEGLGIPRVQQVLTLVAEVLLALIGLLLFLQAANSRFRVQRSLEQREALLAAAIEAAPGLVLLVDRDSRVVMANSTTAEPDSTLVGLTVLDTMPFELGAGERERIDKAIRGAVAGEPARIESLDMGSSSTVRIHEISATPVAGHRDLPAAALVQVLDVTDARRALMRDAQSERLESLGAMAGGLAHDFNNLLFIISGYLQLMQNDRRIRGEADLERYLQHAGDAAERGAEIAKSLLSVTRSQPLQASALNLGTFLQGIVPLAGQALGATRAIDLRVGTGTLDVVVDAAQLSSSVLNLVVNARDATATDGSVLLSVDRRHVDDGEADLSEGDYIVIEVSDDGEGMSPEVLERAFEPFYTTKAVGQGSGLGLASVYSFARQSGGIATIRSREGVGTTVSILIPAMLGQQATGPRPMVPEVTGAVTRVLIVDDEQTLAGLVGGWIADMGVQVRTANSLESALAVAAEFSPDTLLTDMNIGADVDGLDVAARVTLAHPDISVIFMTGFSDRMQQLQQRGMVTLAKPFGRQDLYRVLFPAALADSVGVVTGDGAAAPVDAGA